VSEEEVLVLVNMSDKQVRNVHSYLWTPCSTPFIKKGMAWQQRGVSIYLSLAEQVKFPCLGTGRGASAGRRVGSLG